jgi:predicted ATPase
MTSATYSTRLLERERELGLLRRAWLEAKAGRGAAWLLSAEAGGGKTRLAHELARLAGARVLWGAAEPVTPPEPYLAVTRAIPDFTPAPTRAESVARALELIERAGGSEPILCVLDDLHFADEGTVAVLVRLCGACASHPWLLLATLRPGEGPRGAAIERNGACGARAGGAPRAAAALARCGGRTGRRGAKRRGGG